MPDSPEIRVLEGGRFVAVWGKRRSGWFSESGRSVIENGWRVYTRSEAKRLGLIPTGEERNDDPCT